MGGRTLLGGGAMCRMSGNSFYQARIAFGVSRKCPWLRLEQPISEIIGRYPLEARPLGMVYLLANSAKARTSLKIVCSLAPTPYSTSPWIQKECWL